MLLEVSLIKPIVDALVGALEKAKTYKLRKDATAALSEAIKELMLVNPNENKAHAKIAAAKAAGIINEDLFLAEKMLAAVKVSGSRKPAAKKVATPVAKKAAKTVAKKVAKKKSAKKH
jgi:hypothetical protein